MTHPFRDIRTLSLLFLVVAAPPLHADTLPSLEAGPNGEGKSARALVARGAAPQAAVDVQHYSIDVNFDIPTTSISGIVRVDALALEPTVGVLSLDMGENLEVDGISDESGPLSFSRTGDRLDIDLATPVAAGGDISVEIAYHGVGNVFDDFGLVFSEHESGPNIWTFVEPEGARLWFPCVDRPIDKATVDFTATVDAALTVTSNGPPVDIRSDGETRSWRFEHPYPISTYLVVFNASNFEVIEDSWTPPGETEPMPITHYVYPHLVEPATEDFSITPTAFDLCTEWFGPYPFPDVGYSHTIFPWPGAMEHQGNSSYGAGLITGEHDFDNILVHEVAHHWFGDRVGPADWDEIWLNEGFATYAEVLWFVEVFSEQFGFDVTPLVMAAFHNVYFSFHAGPDHSLFAPPDGHLFCVAEYYKGAAVLHMLRHELGDETFFDLLRTYTDEDSPLSARSKDFQVLAESMAGRDLAWFFDQWVFGPGYPVLETSWENSATTFGDGGILLGDSPAVAVTIEQTQPWAPFRVPVDVRVYAGETIVEDTFVVDSRFARHVIPLPADADSLDIDPNNTLFAQIVEETRLVDVPETVEPPGVIVSPNPFKGAVAIRVPLVGGESMVLRIFDAHGRHVRSFDHVHDDTVHWDGHDGAGSAVSPGMYFLEMERPSGTVVEKLLKVR